MLGTLFNIQPLQTVEDVVSEEFGYIFAEKVVSAIDFIYELKYETALDILYNLPISDKSNFKELFDLFGELFIYNHTFNIIKFADIELKFEQFIDNLDTENENEIVLISICYIILADFYEKKNSDKAIISVKAAGD